MRNVINIIPREFRARGLWVASTLLMRAIVNLAGVAVLLPVLLLVLDPAALTGDSPVAKVYAASGIESPVSFAAAVGCGVVLFIILKSAVVLLLARSERRYIYDLYSTLSRRMYVAYHDMGLGFVKRENSSVLARNVNVVCLQFAAGVLKPAAAIVAEAMFFMLLFTAIAIYAPVAALLAVAVFIPATWIYYSLIRNRINRFGEEENRAQREKARIVAETFRGYADIEINNAFDRMLAAFDRTMTDVVRTRLKEAQIAMLPSVITEVGVAVGMAALVAFGIGGENMRIVFGLFAVAALRLMPSIRAILGAWTTLRYNRYSVEVLQKSLEAVSAETSSVAPSDEKLPFTDEIRVEDVTFRYEDGAEEIFNHYSLSIRKGERVGIRGSSGSGKTTLFNLLLGLYAPTSGRITIDGKPLTTANRRAWQNRIGYVSQNLFLVDGTFAENVALGCRPEEIDRQRAIEALRTARLGDFIESLPQGIDTPIGECGCRLSGGQRQRIGIARALYRQSDVLFFDEATSALDSVTEEEINRSIAALADNNRSLTIVVIAHRESTLDYCDRIITIERK